MVSRKLKLLKGKNKTPHTLERQKQDHHKYVPKRNSYEMEEGNRRHAKLVSPHFV